MASFLMELQNYDCNFTCKGHHIKCFPQNFTKLVRALYFNPLSANPTKWSNTLKQFMSTAVVEVGYFFQTFIEVILLSFSLPKHVGVFLYLKCFMFDFTVHLSPAFPFYIPPENIRKPLVYNLFRRYRKELLVINELMKF